MATKKQKRVGFFAAIVAALSVGGATVQSNFAHTARGHGPCFNTPQRPGCGGTTTTLPATTTTVPPSGAPATPAATGSQNCGNATLLDGPPSAAQIPSFDPSAPSTIVTVGAGNNAGQTYAANTTYYFLAGVHKLGKSQFGQIQPKAGDVFIGQPGAILDGQNKNRYAFTATAANVTIEYLTIRNFGNATYIAGSALNLEGEGVVNHDAGTGWTITHNTVEDNAGAGVFIGSQNSITWNCLDQNGEYGFSSFSPCPTLVRLPNGVVTTYCHTVPPGPTDVTVAHNEISRNDTFDFEAHSPGCGCTGGGKFWATTDADVTSNYVHDNHGLAALWADTVNIGFNFSGNYLADNDGIAIDYEISYNASITLNTFVGNGAVIGPTINGFPDPTIYLSESGGDSRIDNDHGYSTIDISANVFVDNWAGVVLWENASRYCGTHGNPDTGYCTMGDPGTVLGGDPSNIACNNATNMTNSPWIRECRFRTMNVSVHDNTFALVQANVAGCTHAVDCGFNGVFSANADGGFPPYNATGCHDFVEDNITGSVQDSSGQCAGKGAAQGNTFSANRYCGTYTFSGDVCGTGGYWRFMPHEQGQSVTFAQWQAVNTTLGVGSPRHPAFDAGSSCTGCT